MCNWPWKDIVWVTERENLTWSYLIKETFHVTQKAWKDCLNPRVSVLPLTQCRPWNIPGILPGWGPLWGGTYLRASAIWDCKLVPYKKNVQYCEICAIIETLANMWNMWNVEISCVNITQNISWNIALNYSQIFFSKYLIKYFMKYHKVIYHKMFHFISWNTFWKTNRNNPIFHDIWSGSPQIFPYFTCFTYLPRFQLYHTFHNVYHISQYF